MPERRRIGPRRNNRGGKHPRSGRKPGPVDLSVAVLGEEMAAEYKAEKELTAPIEVAIKLYVRGTSKAEIARRLGKRTDTIDHWLTAHKDAIAREVRNYSAVDYFLPYVPLAVETTVDVMQTARPQTRLMAAQTVLDEAFGKAIVRSEHKSHATIQIVYQDRDEAVTVIEGESREVDGGA